MSIFGRLNKNSPTHRFLALHQLSGCTTFIKLLKKLFYSHRTMSVTLQEYQERLHEIGDYTLVHIKDLPKEFDRARIDKIISSPELEVKNPNFLYIKQKIL